MWATVQLRDGKAFTPSLVLGAIAPTVVQMHSSGVVLPLMTAVLWIGRFHRLHLLGAVLGGVLGSLGLLPTLIAFHQGLLPPMSPESSLSSIGFVRIFPLFKEVGYWLRVPSLDMGRLYEESIATMETGWFESLVVAVSVMSVAYVLWGNIDFFRRYKTEVLSPDQRLIFLYCFTSLAVHLFLTGVSPITPQGCYFHPVLHAACIPVVLLTTDLLSGRSRRLFVWFALSFIVLRLPASLFLGCLHPMYNEEVGHPYRDLIDSGKFYDNSFVPEPIDRHSVLGNVPYELPAEEINRELD